MKERMRHPEKNTRRNKVRERKGTRAHTEKNTSIQQSKAKAFYFCFHDEMMCSIFHNFCCCCRWRKKWKNIILLFRWKIVSNFFLWSLYFKKKQNRSEFIYPFCFQIRFSCSALLISDRTIENRFYCMRLSVSRYDERVRNICKIRKCLNLLSAKCWCGGMELCI